MRNKCGRTVIDLLKWADPLARKFIVSKTKLDNVQVVRKQSLHWVKPPWGRLQANSNAAIKGGKMGLCVGFRDGHGMVVLTLANTRGDGISVDAAELQALLLATSAAKLCGWCDVAFEPDFIMVVSMVNMESGCLALEGVLVDEVRCLSGKYNSSVAHVIAGFAAKGNGFHVWECDAPFGVWSLLSEETRNGNVSTLFV